jgi:putative transposase
LEDEQADAWGRARYERRAGQLGARNGSEKGTLKTAEGVLRVEVPQIRGRAEPYRSELGRQVAKTSEVLKRLSVEMYAGGLSQRDIEYSLEKALGHFVLSQSTVRERTDTLSQDYEAVRTRDLSGYEVAYLFMEAVYEPLRRGGSKMGVFCVGAICVAGRKVLLTLSPANRESSERCLEVLRDLVKRGLPTPVTLPTDGAPGLPTALEVLGPKALRIRCWFHKMHNLQQKVPPQAWPEFKALVADLRDAPTVPEAERRRQLIVNRYQRDFPQACRCLLDDAEARLNPLYVPPRHQQYVRTSNLAERAFAEERRRTKVIPHLWDEGSVTKLGFAVLLRVSERGGKKCFSEVEQHQIRSLRQRRQLDEPGVSPPPPTTELQSRRSAASAA